MASLIQERVRVQRKGADGIQITANAAAKSALRGSEITAIIASGRNINLEMVEAGFAEVYRGDPAPGQDLAPYWKAEEKARTAKRGMWTQGDKYISPREWRETHR